MPRIEDARPELERKDTASFTVSRREFIAMTGGLVADMSVTAQTSPNPSGRTPQHTSPGRSLPEPVRQKRPAWWRDEGMAVAGDNWESLLPRLRSGSFDWSQATLDYDDKIAIWQREHSEESARLLKEMGFNLVLIPLYKGGGLKTERPSMEAAKQFTEICHRLGLRVGCYTFSGTILYESLFAEDPTAKDWQTLDHNDHYPTYGDLYFRRWVNRGHPGVRKMMRELVRYAIQEAKVDLIHFDNYVMGPSYESYSVQQFREYLNNRYSAENRERRFGFAEMDYIEPPPAPRDPDGYNGDPLYRDFVDFRCEALADTYRELCEYARSLNPDIVMECNPTGYLGELYPTHGLGTVDHTRLIPWGGVFSDEGIHVGLENGILNSKFRSMMLGRHFGNQVWFYTDTRQAMAESLAYNLQGIGIPIVLSGEKMDGANNSNRNKLMDTQVQASVRFFRREQEYFRDSELVADVGVLNTYANTAYGPNVTRNRWQALTQMLYQGKVPFTLLPDRCPGDLNRFRALVLADLELISDDLLNAVRDYAQNGGGLVVTGQTGGFDEQNHRRKDSWLQDLFQTPVSDKVLRANPGQGRAIYIPQVDIPEKFQVGMLPENCAEILEAIRWAANNPLQVEVKAPETVTMSLQEQPSGRRLLHLVNYDEGHPVSNIDVNLQLSPARHDISSIRLLTPDSDGVQTLSARLAGGTVNFTVPRLEVYALLVVD